MRRTSREALAQAMALAGRPVPGGALPAELYDLLMGWMRDPAGEAAVLSRWLGASPAAVLDAGCGTGHVYEALVRLHRRVVGLDVSAAYLEATRGRLGAAPAAVLVRADLGHPLPFPPGAFGGVSALFSVCDIVSAGSDRLRLLREFRRCLRPGGLLVLDGVDAVQHRRNYPPGRRIEFASHAVVVDGSTWTVNVDLETRWTDEGLLEMSFGHAFRGEHDFVVHTLHHHCPLALAQHLEVLREAGFANVAAFSSFNETPAFEDDADYLLLRAEAGEGCS